MFGSILGLVRLFLSHVDWMGLEKIVKDFDLFGIKTHPIPPNPHGLGAKRTSPNRYRGSIIIEIMRFPPSSSPSLFLRASLTTVFFHEIFNFPRENKLIFFGKTKKPLEKYGSKLALNVFSYSCCCWNPSKSCLLLRNPNSSPCGNPSRYRCFTIIGIMCLFRSASLSFLTVFFFTFILLQVQLG